MRNPWLHFGFMLSLIFPSLIFGQEFRATLTGAVMDSSKAAVPNAVVQVTNTATNEVASATTDSQGNYTIPFLKPGNYTVTVQVVGFKKFVREGVTLNVAQTATVSITLELGAVTEQVTVVAEAPLLETAKADRGGVIDNQRVEEFPLNARNPFMLSMLVAGVNYNGNAIYQRPFDNGAIAEWSINGSQTRQNEFLLDGAPNNAQAGGNNIAYVPPVDSVQEFKIQTNSYDAQYGKTGGGIVNVSLKSGTNNFHGAVYEFARRNQWDANSFQNNSRNAPREGHFLDQYGVELGGPVYLPKLLDGRDKTFFMFNYEGYREGTPTPLTLSVPQPEMLNGDFSKLVDANGNKISIFDPKTGRNVNGVWVRDPFPDNIIRPERINPNARKILGFMPKPNTVTPGQGYSQQNLFIPGGANVDRDDFYNTVIKVDKNIGDKQRMFFRYARNDRTENRNTNGIKQGPGQDGQHPLKRINDAAVVDWVRTLSPTFILNVRTSFNRYVEGSRGDGNKGFDLTALGFAPSLVSQLPVQGFFGRYEFDGYINLGRYFGFNYTNTFAVHPTMTKIHGAHAIKAGVDMRWIQYAEQNAGNPFRSRGQKNYTQKDYNRGDGLSGNSIAEFLLGTPSAGGIDNNVFPMYLYKYFAPYVQDDWKVNRRLTLNLGLRWDFNVPPNERHNRMDRSFDPNVINPADSLIDRTRFPNVPQLRGGLQFAGDKGVPRGAANLYKFAIQPRIGAAYLLTPKLVVRGGWGRYYLNPNNDYLQRAGFNQATPYISSLDGGRTPIPNTLNNPFPSGVLIPPGNSLGLATFLGRGFDFVNPNFKVPHVDQFSFGFEYELPAQAKLEVSYVGNRTKNNQSDRAFNEPDLAMRKQCNLMEGGNPLFCDQQPPNPFQNLDPFRGTNFSTDPGRSRWDLARPYSEFGGLTQKARNDGLIWYNSLQVVFEKRSKGGLNIISTYTLSKMMERWGFNDVQQNIMQQGLYFADRPHRFTLGSVYQLPFGQGKRWLNTSHPLWSRLVSGWENTVIFQWQSGRPWDLPDNVIYLKDAKVPNIDWSAPRVYGVSPCVAKWNDNGTITMQSFSVKAGCTDYNFLIKPRYAPRFTTFRDPRLRLHTVPQADVSLNKMTRITERMSLQFRIEAFNVTNTFMFHRENFNRDPENAKFGSIDKGSVGQGNTNFPRQIQFGFKFLW